MIVPHGYQDEPGLSRVLRGRPPRDTLEWVRQSLGATRVTRVRVLRGGESSAVHMVTLEGATGACERVVLRRYVLDWLAEEPWIPSNEVAVLQLLEESPILAPQLLVSDIDGRVTGTPAIVMSALPGRIEWEPRDFDAWQRQLAEALPPVHAVPVSPRLRRFAPYPAEHPVPPEWSRHRWAWEAAVSLYEEGPPADVQAVFIHRDYHPGNVLWTGGRITGVVDWASACVGPAEEDVAHCRENITRHLGQEAADRFLATWQSVSGVREYHPYWDLTNVLSKVGTRVDERLDDFAAAAARRL